MDSMLLVMSSICVSESVVSRKPSSLGIFATTFAFRNSWCAGGENQEALWSGRATEIFIVGLLSLSSVKVVSIV
jgi:hypothetical protein